MSLGSFGSYRLPQNIREAYGVTTAKDLADYLGVDPTPSSALARDAETAWRDLKSGDQVAARAFLRDRLGVDEARIEDALSRFPR